MQSCALFVWGRGVSCMSLTIVAKEIAAHGPAWRKGLGSSVLEKHEDEKFFNSLYEVWNIGR